MPSPETILLVEHNEADQYIARHVLRKHWPDTEVLIAADGREAMELLDQRQGRPPALILLDINMPRMNGHEFLEAWYQDQKAETPVVVMLTSSMQEEDKRRASQYQCVRDYLIKPLSGEALDNLGW